MVTRMRTWKEVLDKMMWDRGRFRVCGGDFVELRKKQAEKKDMIADRNPDLDFIAYDSWDQNQYPEQIASFFHQNHSISYNFSLHGYIYVQHLHYTCNY